MNSIKLKAPAKLNLGLEVLNKRTDGYHNINTVFYRTYLSDKLIISEHSDLLIECIPPLSIPIQQNLVYKAATVLKNFYCINQGATITIYKNIPIGGGLAGGSTDAASALSGLAQLWNITFGYGELESLASLIGSDVPYFTNEGTAAATGRGEVLSYFDFNLPWWILIVNPGINISTAWAYKSLNRTELHKEPKDFKGILIDSIDNPELLNKNVFNDFEDVIFEKYPEISRIKSFLYKYGAFFALMTGSGSSVYGLFFNEDQCTKASEIFSNYKTFICPPKD